MRDGLANQIPNSAPIHDRAACSGPRGRSAAPETHSGCRLTSRCRLGGVVEQLVDAVYLGTRMSFPIIPQNLSISAMRSSGYRDTAHALAELIDNAIQAGEGTQSRTEVEVICIDEVPAGGRRQISRLAVYDNACGMSPSL